MNDKKLGERIALTKSFQPGLLFKKKILIQLFENGFLVEFGKEEKAILFADVEAFSFACTSLWVNGIAQGTHYSACIWPFGCDKAKPYSFGFSLWSKPTGETFLGIPLFLSRYNPNHDETLEVIRTRLTEVVASRLLESLDAGQTVPWVPGVNICSDGIEFNDQGQTLVSSWTETRLQHHTSDGICKLQSGLDGFPSIALQTKAINFYPGLAVVEQFLSPCRTEFAPA